MPSRGTSKSLETLKRRKMRKIEECHTEAAKRRELGFDSRQDKNRKAAAKIQRTARAGKERYRRRGISFEQNGESCLFEVLVSG
jgi:hypothetical protein